jgi:hypothetical protein
VITVNAVNVSKTSPTTNERRSEDVNIRASLPFNIELKDHPRAQNALVLSKIRASGDETKKEFF